MNFLNVNYLPITKLYVLKITFDKVEVVKEEEVPNTVDIGGIPTLVNEIKHTVLKEFTGLSCMVDALVYVKDLVSDKDKVIVDELISNNMPKV